MFYDERSLRHVYRGCNIGRFCSYYCSCCCFWCYFCCWCSDVISVVDISVVVSVALDVVVVDSKTTQLTTTGAPMLLPWPRSQCHHPDPAPMSLPWPRPNVITLTTPQCHYPDLAPMSLPCPLPMSLPWPRPIVITLTTKVQFVCSGLRTLCKDRQVR